jgi:PPOX class probable F420-dependent enzyme
MTLPGSAQTMIESGRLAHLVTLNPDGSPQVSCVWVGLDGEEIVSAHLRADQQKLRNIRRDPRVSLSIEGTEIQPPGLLQYLVVHGRARLEDGGAPELLQDLARRYLGPDVVFPPMPDPPPGVVVRITVERLGGVGPWASPGG